MKKKFASASILAVILLVLSGSGVRSTYSATSVTIVSDACKSACVDQLYACLGSGQNRGRCLGQYHSCENKCK